MRFIDAFWHPSSGRYGWHQHCDGLRIKGAHAVFQKAIVDLIDVGKIVDGVSIVVLIIDTHFVVQDVVETNVLERCDFLHFPQVAAVSIAQRENARPEPNVCSQK